MKIFFAGSFGKERMDDLLKNRCNLLISYYSLVARDYGYGMEDRWKEIIKRSKNGKTKLLSSSRSQ